MGVLSGPDRFQEAAAAALGLTLLVMWVGSRRGIKVDSLEVFGAVVFAVFVALGAFAPAGTIRWLELWAGELTNGALAAFAIVTVLIRRPFTMAYARDTVDPAHWNSPLFIRVNYVLTAVWAAAFSFSTVVGTLGDALWRDGDNFFTGWILQLGGIFAAVAVTEFYPDYARAKALMAAGEPSGPPPSPARLLDWLPAFVVGVGRCGGRSETRTKPHRTLRVPSGASLLARHVADQLDAVAVPAEPHDAVQTGDAV
jgi:hypothetical protein